MPSPSEGDKNMTPVLIDVPTDDKSKNKKKKGTVEADEISEEDKILKEGLELAVQRLQEPEDPSVHKLALDHLASEIKSATSSMTSVPKPLKFLRLHYESLKSVYQSWSSSNPMKVMLADVLSVLAMTMALPNSRECLKFKLQGTKVNISSWGHEYVRSLAGEVSEEYNQRSIESPAEDEVDVDDLLALVDDMVPFQMQHNAEAEAVDLLIEVQELKKLIDNPVVDERNYQRVCLYLLRCANFVSDPDDLYNLFSTAYSIYKSQKKYPDALRVALKMDDTLCRDKIDELFSEDLGASPLVKMQMAFILARHKSNYEIPDDPKLDEIISNSLLSQRYLNVARDMDLLDPKTPDDIFKVKNATGGLSRMRGLGAVDTAKSNLASSFVNGFVNAGHCSDKLMSVHDSTWVSKNKDHGQISAVASLGMVMLWDVSTTQIEKYFLNSDNNIKAGACLGMGILSSGVRSENDIAFAILSEYIEDKSSTVKVATICGLGIAYAGSNRADLKDVLMPFVQDSDANITEVSMAALALGLICTGSCNDEVGSVLVERLMISSAEDLDHTISRYLCLGLGLLYLGKGELVEPMLEVVRTVEHKRGKYADITLQTCAHAGSGNVLKVQNMLHICAEHLTENAEHQAVAVLGIALTSVGEDIGTEMTLRTFEHLLHYGEPPVKRVVPLALALLYVSNPDYGIVDQLSRLSHDQDAELAQCAVLGLGLVSAGTCNSRVAGLLRQLSEFYSKEPDHQFIVKIAQGLTHMGKGLMSISPFHSDRLLMSGPAMGGVLAVLHACIDMKGTILDKFHYVMYFLTPAINTRFMSTLDEQLNPVVTNVRVGQAVETVGQAGRPKTITGFQTHTTPVLLGYKDRAELASQEYIPLSSVMEGIVILEQAQLVSGSDVVNKMIL